MTQKPSSRLAAAAWIGAELVPGNDLLKGGTKLVSKIDDVADVAKVANAIDDVGDGAKVVRSSTKKVINPLENINYTDKVKRQMRRGDFHSFPEAVDSFGADGKITKIIGGDGITRTKVEISGSYREMESLNIL